MKKTAILIYDSFCNFEISTVLEILALAEKTDYGFWNYKRGNQK